MRLPRMPRKVLATCGLLLCGCAGGSVLVKAPNIDYPVSATQAVFDTNGNIVIPAEHQKLGHFSFGWKNWTIMWTAIPLTGREQDISDLLAHEIESRSGNAIVNLKLTTSGGPVGYVTALLGIIPSYVSVSVEGDVVRVE